MGPFIHGYNSNTQTTEFYTFCKDISGPDIGLEQSRILELVKEEPGHSVEKPIYMNASFIAGP